MNKILLMLFLACVLLASPARGQYAQTGSGYIYTNTYSLTATLVNQDPYPAVPGEYVNLLFKLENFGNENAQNVVFQLLPTYPFSLDPGANATVELGTVKGLQTEENAFLIKYRARVDKDAIDGENEIKVAYGTGTDFYKATFNATVSNPRTDFDVIVQDSSTTSTTLAIVNIGANTGYSIIVRVPDQESFRVSGVSANVIGNLNAGDYTLTSFQVTSMSTLNATGMGFGARREPAGNFTGAPTNRSNNLVVEISYTDTSGIRRTVQKEVKLDLSGTTVSLTSTRFQGSQTQTTSNGLLYIIIGIVGIVAIAAFFKLRKRKKK